MAVRASICIASRLFSGLIDHGVSCRLLLAAGNLMLDWLGLAVAAETVLSTLQAPLVTLPALSVPGRGFSSTTSNALHVCPSELPLVVWLRLARRRSALT
jgi:hypothetical protein